MTTLFRRKSKKKKYTLEVEFYPICIAAGVAIEPRETYTDYMVILPFIVITVTVAKKKTSQYVQD